MRDAPHTKSKKKLLTYSYPAEPGKRHRRDVPPLSASVEVRPPVAPGDRRINDPDGLQEEDQAPDGKGPAGRGDGRREPVGDAAVGRARGDVDDDENDETRDEQAPLEDQGARKRQFPRLGGWFVAAASEVGAGVAIFLCLLEVEVERRLKATTSDGEMTTASETDPNASRPALLFSV